MGPSQTMVERLATFGVALEGRVPPASRGGGPRRLGRGRLRPAGWSAEEECGSAGDGCCIEGPYCEREAHRRRDGAAPGVAVAATDSEIRAGSLSAASVRPPIARRGCGSIALLQRSVRARPSRYSGPSMERSDRHAAAAAHSPIRIRCPFLRGSVPGCSQLVILIACVALLLVSLIGTCAGCWLVGAPLPDQVTATVSSHAHCANAVNIRSAGAAVPALTSTRSLGLCSLQGGDPSGAIIGAGTASTLAITLTQSIGLCTSGGSVPAESVRIVFEVATRGGETANIIRTCPYVSAPFEIEQNQLEGIEYDREYGEGVSAAERATYPPVVGQCITDGGNTSGDNESVMITIVGVFSIGDMALPSNGPVGTESRSSNVNDLYDYLQIRSAKYGALNAPKSMINPVDQQEDVGVVSEEICRKKETHVGTGEAKRHVSETQVVLACVAARRDAVARASRPTPPVRAKGVRFHMPCAMALFATALLVHLILIARVRSQSFLNVFVCAAFCLQIGAVCANEASVCVKHPYPRCDGFLRTFSEAENPFGGLGTNAAGGVLEGGYQLGQLGRSAPTFFDVDGNGHDDLVVTLRTELYTYKLKVLLNDGVGGWQKATGTQLTSWFSNQNVALGAAGGKVKCCPTNSQSAPIVTFHDVNGDGFADLVVGNRKKSTLRLWLNKRGCESCSNDWSTETTGSENPFSSLTLSVYNAGATRVQGGVQDRGASWAAPTFFDVNNDGHDDLVVGNGDKQDFKVFLNDGNNVYTALDSGSNPFFVLSCGKDPTPVFADVNNDGHIDAVCGGQSSRIVVSLGNGRGAWPAAMSEGPFANLQLDSLDNAPAFFDVNNDGYLDLIVAGLCFNECSSRAKAHELRVFYSIPLPQLNFPVQATGSGNMLNFVNTGNFAVPFFADFNNDGYDDFVLGGWGSNVEVYVNGGSTNPNTFTQLTDDGITAPQAWASPTVYDVNGDGFLDVIVGSGKGPGYLTLYINDGISPLHWTASSTHGFPKDNVNDGAMIKASFFDANGDGLDDIVVTAVGDNRQPYVFYNTKDLALRGNPNSWSSAKNHLNGVTLPSPFPTVVAKPGEDGWTTLGSVSMTATFVDVDRDGFKDLVITHSRLAAPRLYFKRNDAWVEALASENVFLSLGGVEVVAFGSLNGQASCPGITAQYVYIDGSGATGDLNLHEVVIKSPYGTGYTIVSGAMSSTSNSDVVSNCYNGFTSGALCGTASAPSGIWAYFDLGTPKCVGTVHIYNYGAEAGRIVGAKLSLRATVDGAPLWERTVTSGTQNGGHILGFTAPHSPDLVTSKSGLLQTWIGSWCEIESLLCTSDVAGSCQTFRGNAVSPGGRSAFGSTRKCACSYGYASMDCSVCDIGFGQMTIDSQQLCLYCPPGQVNNAADAAACADCSQGYKCAGAASTPVKCHNAATPAGSSTCTSCPAGLYPTESGLAAADFKVVQLADLGIAANALCKFCEVGFECADGVSRTACSGTTVAESTGTLACLPVPAGKKRVSASSAINCDAGYKCAGAASTPVKCHNAATPAGSSTCTSCPAGLYPTESGISSFAVKELDALADPAGAVCKDCEAGYECPDGASRNPCSALNKYSDVAATLKCANVIPGKQKVSDTSVEDCSQGYACPNTNGDTVKSLCENTATPAGSAACVPCGAGTYPDGAACLPCDVGYDCADGTIRAVCSDSTFAAATGALACLPVPPGKVRVSASSAVDCAEGFMCTGGAAAPARCGNPLTPSGSATCLPCSAGQYPLNAVCTPCEAGFKCTDGTAAGREECSADEYSDSVASPICFPVVAGYYRKSSKMVMKCPAGSKCGGGIALPEPCPAGRYSENEGANDCVGCAAQMYSNSNARVCMPCGANGMDCSRGVLKVLPGWWYDVSALVVNASTGAKAVLEGSTAMYPCVNPGACRVYNNSAVSCAEHTSGPLCAVCEEGHVPDASALDGRCKVCESSMAERWAGKVFTFACGALLFFFVSVIVLMRPAPKLKIDPLLTQLNVRRIVRRFRKRALRRLTTRGAVLDANTCAQCIALLDKNQLDAVVELRRTTFAALAAGNASTAVSASMGLNGEVALAYTAVLVGEQIAQTAVEGADRAMEDVMGAPDVDGSLDPASGSSQSGAVVNAVATSGVVAQLRSCGFVAQLTNTVAHFMEDVSGLISAGQLKIAMGNLQINASLTVVFTIPWPPMHVKFIRFLSVFKLDLFKGLAFAAPCLHSSHFMSLATFVAAPACVAAVLALTLGLVVLSAIAGRSCPMKHQRALRKLPCCRYTIVSAITAAIKLGIVVVLFIYPTICSKVFMTFQCVDVGGASHMLADMSYTCYSGEWLIWAGVAVASMLLYIIGIPLTLVVLLRCKQRQGTLQYPDVCFEDSDDINPSDVDASVRRVNEHLHNILAYGSLYQQVRAYKVVHCTHPARINNAHTHHAPCFSPSY